MREKKRAMILLLIAMGEEYQQEGGERERGRGPAVKFDLSDFVLL